jgi:hypothetical protein
VDLPRINDAGGLATVARGNARLLEAVRQRPGSESGHHSIPAEAERLAHPSASFPIVLNANCRVVDDPLQWIVQERKGNPRSKNAGWRGRLFFRTRDGLLTALGGYFGELHPEALASLLALPERHR